MRYNGIVRHVDNLGRIVIPKEYRDILGIDIQDKVETIIRGKEIIVRKFEAGCTICGNTERLYKVVGREICGGCISIIREYELERHG